VLGNSGRIRVVLHQHRAAERPAQPLSEREPGPAGQRGPEPYGSVGLDDPRGTDPDGAQTAARDPGPPQHIGDQHAHPLQPFVRTGRLRHIPGPRADDAPVQARQQRGDTVRADLDTQQMTGLGPEPEPPGRASLTARTALLGDGLDDQAGLDEPLGHALDGRPG
jgi:hypothetical protein